MAEQALRAVRVTAGRLHAAEDAQREAIRAANEAGSSLRQIATAAGLSHEQVRRIVQGDSVAPYSVTVERLGVSPLQLHLLVRAPSKRAAGEMACWISERERGGTFEVRKIRRAARKVSAFPERTYDDTDL
jgi:predicted transcriptional regulator